MPTNLTHSFYERYEPLRPLIKDLAGILVIGRHWLLVSYLSDPRNDPYYVEAFQRLNLKFMIENRGEESMGYPVEKTFRKVEGVQQTVG
jgi:hypothetical protein